MEDKKTAQQIRLGMYAGALFSLAGLVEVAVGIFQYVHAAKVHGANAIFPVIGLTFTSIGCMWLAIAGSWKKKAQREQ